MEHNEGNDSGSATTTNAWFDRTMVIVTLFTLIVAVAGALYLYLHVRKQAASPPHRASDTRTVLIEKILLRQGKCRILDLGSGWVDAYGFFQITQKYRAAGQDVTLTAVDVIFPPLSAPDDWTGKPHNNLAELARLHDLQMNHGITCVGQDIGAFVRDAARDYILGDYLEHCDLASGRQSSPTRFDIIHKHYVFGQSTVQQERPLSYSDLAVLLNPGGFLQINQISNHGHVPCHVLATADRIAKSMGCGKARMVQELPTRWRMKDILVVQKVPMLMNGYIDVSLVGDLDDLQ